MPLLSLTRALQSLSCLFSTVTWEPMQGNTCDDCHIFLLQLHVPFHVNQYRMISNQNDVGRHFRGPEWSIWPPRGHPFLVSSHTASCFFLVLLPLCLCLKGIPASCFGWLLHFPTTGPTVLFELFLTIFRPPAAAAAEALGMSYGRKQVRAATDSSLWGKICFKHQHIPARKLFLKQVLCIPFGSALHFAAPLASSRSKIFHV